MGLSPAARPLRDDRDRLVTPLYTVTVQGGCYALGLGGVNTPKPGGG
jgi:hypothetical protein